MGAFVHVDSVEGDAALPAARLVRHVAARVLQVAVGCAALLRDVDQLVAVLDEVGLGGKLHRRLLELLLRRPRRLLREPELVTAAI